MINVEPLKNNTCAVIITYNPDKDFYDRANRIAPQVNKTIIIDNCSNKKAINMLQEVSSQLKTVLILNSKNKGIATALNQGMNWAQQNNFSWVITFDQDSIVQDSMFQIFQNTYDQLVAKNKIALIGSNYIDLNSGCYLIPLDSDHHFYWYERKSAITSGSLYSLEAFRQIGPFRDEFFIDLVDLEYCLRARARGFKIYATIKPTMAHAIGKTTLHKIIWKKFGTTNHSPERRYYIARNNVAMSKEYLLTDPAFVISTLYSRFKSIVLIIFFESNKISKIRLTLLGFIDGLLNKFDRNIKIC
jgi:rhamnosyltransferase